jgi:hypothetical protein
MRNIRGLFILFLFLVKTIFAQTDSVSNREYKNRKMVLASTSALVAAGSLLYLNQAWYAEYNTGKFHFFNDNGEWLQMDKAGHAFSTYQSSRLMMNGFKWAGYNRKQTLFIGGTLGFFYLTAVEVMDGYSEGWGFSWGDMAANALGTSLAMTQQAFWNEQRIQIKYSFAQSGLAQYNPSLLGETIYSQWLKDYNGQTYWLSINPSTFLKEDTKFPKWLNLAFGYSAYGMIGGSYNAFLVQDNNGNVLKLDRKRRYYLSIDIDLTRIKTKSKFLKGLFSAFNILKIPAPTLQFSNTGIRFYYLYY